MRRTLKFEQEHDKSTYRCLHGKSFLGHLALDVDGFYYFWPDVRSQGYWSDWMLFDILTALRQINSKVEVDLATSPHINPPLDLGQ